MGNLQYFTFGFGHHTPGGIPLRDTVVCIEGEPAEARSKLVEVVGGMFAFQYPTAESAGVDEYGLTVISFDEFVCVWSL